MSSIRQQIINAIDTRLQTIIADNVVTLRTGRSYTYQTDLGANVHEWRKTRLADSEATALLFQDAESPKTTDGVPIGMHRHQLHVEITVVVQANTPATEVRKMIADVCACVGVDPKWSDLARWSAIASDEISKEENGRDIAGAEILLIVEYDSNLWEV